MEAAEEGHETPPDDIIAPADEAPGSSQPPVGAPPTPSVNASDEPWVEDLFGGLPPLSADAMPVYQGHHLEGSQHIQIGLTPQEKMAINAKLQPTRTAPGGMKAETVSVAGKNGVSFAGIGITGYDLQRIWSRSRGGNMAAMVISHARTYNEQQKKIQMIPGWMPEEEPYEILTEEKWPPVYNFTRAVQVPCA